MIIALRCDGCFGLIIEVVLGLICAVLLDLVCVDDLLTTFGLFIILFIEGDGVCFGVPLVPFIILITRRYFGVYLDINQSDSTILLYRGTTICLLSGPIKRTKYGFGL